MRVISKKPIREFWELHPESRPALDEWFRKVDQLAAESFPELRQSFRSADYVDGFTVFDVGGNKYRIVTVIHYDKRRLYVRQVMTHAEYDRNAWRKK
ncbi:type II toxin-antitoxin system HigB family toxin [uncultured Lamprocystis sp.]|jgi:mRNA interferase HigB|uniref:type II toxin-antitoxin system HigB family toxin n=1 Tax=uncultured Lamprocystis sp. TaxID=543132 RepID=UPI0025D5E717|nr:type II toxin-antitoxin system HigB family toxin [uncultured Lamprocystis sp.]